MRREFRGMSCGYCAVAPATTDDHIFAGKLFLEKDRGDLPKAPACEECNGRKAALELELSTVLAFGGRHPAAENNLTSNTSKRLAKNEKLHRRLADSLEPAFLRDGGIIYQKTSTIGFDYEKLEELLKFIGRGLTWYHWHTYLNSDDDVAVIIETKSDSPRWSPQNRPIESSQDKSSYSALEEVSARLFERYFTFPVSCGKLALPERKVRQRWEATGAPISGAGRAGWQRHPVCDSC